MPEAKLRPSTAHDFNSTTFLELAQWVKRQLGIVFSTEQKEQFADRVRSFVSARQLTPESLLAALNQNDHTLSRELAEAVSTNYTFFMRESETFDFMRHNILPHLPEGPHRIWSAAASSGDEAYTVAMHAVEHFGTSAPERIKILGTDISQRQIAIAEAGIYPAEQLSLV
ncbi:MAG TPA: CheR family methyltransferase, partial [Polyangiales bacterium]